jgi:hypothetical protein
MGLIFFTFLCIHILFQMKNLKKIGSLLHNGWMAFARALAYVNTRIILTLVFLLIIGPIALVLKLIQKDFLHRRIDSSPSFWLQREPADHTLDQARRQF